MGETMYFNYCRDDVRDRGNCVLEIMDKRFTEDAIEVREAKDIPDMLPNGVHWAELNMLIYPGQETTPFMREDRQSYFDKKSTLFYIQSFFEQKYEALYFHVWGSRVNHASRKKPIHLKHIGVEGFSEYFVYSRPLGTINNWSCMNHQRETMQRCDAISYVAYHALYRSSSVLEYQIWGRGE